MLDRILHSLKPLFLFLLLTLVSCSSKQKELSVFQFNIWQEGTMVEGGFDAIVDNIINVNPDMVTFSEVRNYNEVDFITHLTSELEKKGVKYYGKSSVSTGIISKYPIVEQSYVFPYEGDSGSVLKAKIEVEDRVIVLYSAHLDYKNYACYLPRGYSGSTWQKIEQPITDPDSILTASRKSKRLNAIEALVADSKKELLQKHIVIIGGDFNEPSHLDWQENTKNLWDHNGAVVNWDCSVVLYENGFKDTYREAYPDPVKYPGFTFPSDNADAKPSKLTWAPDADERDRIDFIYYRPTQQIAMKESAVVGPSSSIVRSERQEEETDDKFILPNGVWPTDHKGVVSTFIIK